MTKTLLKFSSSIYLLAFRKFSKARHWEINLNELTVYCDCSEKEAMYACKEFNAVRLIPGEAISSVPGKLAEMNLPQASYRAS